MHRSAKGGDVHNKDDDDVMIVRLSSVIIVGSSNESVEDYTCISLDGV